MKFETLQVHGGQSADAQTGTVTVPLHLTTAYQFKDSAHGARLFELKEFGNLYTRLQNPTTDVFEKRMAMLEGGVAALATSSGQAAASLVINLLCKQGENFVSSPYLYGGSYNLFNVSYKRFGVECRTSQDNEIASVEPLIDDHTKFLYVESIGNPAFAIPDLDAWSALAKKNNLPLVVDNTFGAGGYVCRPIEHGANILVESATKWIGGHAGAMGGVVVDAGNFDWSSGRFPDFTEPSEGYHGLKFYETFGNLAFIIKARVEGLRDYGACQSPFNAYQMLIGLETLSIRLDKQCQNTLALAHWLEKHPKVESVSYPGLASHPDHARAQKYLQHGFGGVLSFVVKGEKEDVVRLVDNLKMVYHVANVGDVRTLIIQPSATTHQQLPEEDQLTAGVLPTLLRVSLGIEHIDDIIADFEQAFKSL